MDSRSWDESFETGDPLVDEQHRNIHMLVDYVEGAHGDPDAIMNALERLMEHVSCHFATEEALMDKTGFNGQSAEEHLADHRRLTQEARDVVLKFRSGELADTQPVVEFLRAWLSDHVHAQDRVFIEHVREQGAAAVLPEPWASDPLQSPGDQVA